MSQTTVTPAVHGARAGLAYGLLGLPLAFVALPLYVLLPNHYAREYGMPLATLGTVLLAARLLDAGVDPWLGRLSDRLFGRSASSVLRIGAGSALLLAAGLSALFLPPEAAQASPGTLIVWALVTLVVTYLAYSQLSIAHQAWGARLGGDELQRGRIVAWREGAALIGVLTASVLPSLFGLPVMLSVFAASLAVGWLAWCGAPRPPAAPGSTADTSALWRPLQRPAFRRLLLAFVLNGIASAIPATLVLFFVQDRLQAAPAQESWFLGAYFLCAALSIPLWLRVVARIGLGRTWLAGMLLAVAVFVWTLSLGTGDIVPFLVVCALSGVALGTDLAVPSALLAGVVAQEGDQGRHEGAYFGWWNFATKLNLALAAGLALPLLQWWGYSPGTRTPEGLTTLTMAYALLPCLLKLAAAAALWWGVLRPAHTALAPTSAQG
ncbi:MFS transporter [Acidovorax lacteus]|uniref:MFS transporter n=1 Tax=Acidovorax lacteus TaxID=1924988 RepID=A0ABP8LCV7_9BURK